MGESRPGHPLSLRGELINEDLRVNHLRRELTQERDAWTTAICSVKPMKYGKLALNDNNNNDDDDD